MKTVARLLPILVSTFPAALLADVVVNEAMWDDTGAADDREFVELFNSGLTPVDISGWVLTGRDVTTQNQSATIPGALGSGTTLIAPGGFYVFGNTGTLNVNQIVAGGFLENDNETIELYNGPFGTSTLIDAFAYETNKGTNFGAPAGMIPAATVLAQTGIGYFGNHQGVDLPVSPLNASVSLGRFVDGRDTNNNGRDFGLRPSTPGTTNAPGGLITSYTLPDPAPFSLGTDLPGHAGSFVNPRVVDPTVIDANNPNAISAPDGPGSKAYVAWDPSGGGNGTTTGAAFGTIQSAFSIRAFFDTTDLPVQSGPTGTPFRGSEISMYGIGSGDALVNLTDLGGDIGIGAGTLPASDTANGFTGYAWIYERVGSATVGGPISEKLYLIDANDGGDSDLGGNTPLDWTILATIDLSLTSSGWYNLSLSIDGSGNGTAAFDGAITNFLATGLNSGAFNVGYRENLQILTDTTPDALMRPATFTVVPEPSAALLLLGAAMPLGLRRRRR